MDKPAVIQIVGYKNRGKTTLVSRLVAALKELGYRIGTIKHDAHQFDLDFPGTDTWQHREAGAEIVTITSPEHSAFFEQRAVPISELLERMKGLDLVLIEGFKNAPFPKIVLIKEASDKSLLNRLDRVIGAASWIPCGDPGIPVFSVDDTNGILQLVKKQMKLHEEDANVDKEWGHFNKQQRAHMIDVSDKPTTARKAVASSRVTMRRETMRRIKDHEIGKGDVLAVAQVAGIMAAKRTPDWIPMCHSLQLSGVDLSFDTDSENVLGIRAAVKTKGPTGVEMEALTAASAAALTVYDMCKGIDKDMAIGPTYLESKTGGKSGDYLRRPQEDGNRGENPCGKSE